MNTYNDTVAHALIDYGVEVYLSYGDSKAFFERFDIPTKAFTPQSLNSVYVNSENGHLLSNYTPPAGAAEGPAYETWYNLTAPYKDMMNPGFWNFPNGSDIPELLLTPFGEVAKKYNLESIIPSFMTTSNVGIGGTIADTLTMYVMIAFGYEITKDLLSDSMFVPAYGSNSLLYERAYALLKDDVLLESFPIAAERNDSGVKVVVQSFDGSKKLIRAKKLLFTPPPSEQEVAALDPDEHELEVLSHWTPTYSFIGVARVPGIPINDGVYWTAPSAAPDNYMNVRNWPWTMLATSTGLNDSTVEVLMSTNYSISQADAQELCTKNFEGLFAPGGAYANATNTTIEWLAFGNHNSILWRMPASLLQQGFVQDLYSLQGPRSTWYTGGLWCADYSGDVWVSTVTNHDSKNFR